MRGKLRKILAFALCVCMLLGGSISSQAKEKEGEEEILSESIEMPEETETPEETEIPEDTPVPEPSAIPEQTGVPTETVPAEEPGNQEETVESEGDPEGGQTGEISLTGEAAGYAITVTGPGEYFPEDTELALSVETVEPEREELAKEAVEEQAEAQQKEVKDYTAFDIRIFSGGQEIQPAGPVQVSFTKLERESSEGREIMVFHVDEDQGTAEDMEASVNGEGQAVIETTHFSVYVIVDLDQLGGSINLTVQHWATVNQLKGVDGREGLIMSAGPDGVPGNATAWLQSEDVFQEIYSADVIELDNTIEKSVEDLSKVLLADAVEEEGRGNYELIEIWFLKEGKDPASENREDWEIYPSSSDQKITLKKDTTLRLVYDPVAVDDNLVRNVTFYDYDVTDGKIYKDENCTIEDPNGGYLNTNNQGINSASNYNGGNEWNRLAVGMSSTWVDHSYHNATAANGVLLNWAGDGLADSAKKGIVAGIGENGPIYNGVADAGLFNNDPKTGKTVLNDYKLHFDQVGDTYTLSSVSKNGATVLSGLETFREIWDKPGENRHIFSNNFWPLDGERHENQDPLLGGSTVYKVKKVHTFTGVKDTGASDDNVDHNWFFGMRYSMGFVLGDYTGPLNYYFRGDDDFWLFVDGELATDLGGIHSSVGELLDLTPYVISDPENGPTEEEKTTLHRIDIVYAERGAFGSTCYMQFTLPNLRPVDFDTDVPTTDITVQKNWQDHGNPGRPDAVQVQLSYRKTGETEWTLYDTQTLNAANHWSYTWAELPKTGYEYMIHEVGESGGINGKYTVTYDSGGKMDGTLTAGEDGSFTGTITNRLSPSTWITVNKVWDDRNSPERPASADFYLYYRQTGSTEWNPYPDGRMTLTAADTPEGGDGNTWTGVYTDLPVFWRDTDTRLEYTVMEVEGDTVLKPGDKMDGSTVSDLYTVHYPEGHFDGDGSWTPYPTKDNAETMSLTVTNSLGGSLQVVKEWKGTGEVPDTVIYAGLYSGGSPAAADTYAELNPENSFTAVFTYLTPGREYTVKELRPAGNGETPEFTIGEQGYIGIEEGGKVMISQVSYDVSYQFTPNDSGLQDARITNTARWQMVKRSSSSGDLKLEGAVFTLTGENGAVYTGTSGADGIVNWKDPEGGEVTGLFPDGTYTLKETAAPVGYQLNTEAWTLEIVNGAPKINQGEMQGTLENGILTFYYENTPMYTLPNSGGPGIYLFGAGGVLLTAAGAWLLFRNRKEVL